MAQVHIKGKGPIYWAKEYGAEGKIIDTAWMAETAPPFRVGHALRFRVGSRAVHLGFCRKSKKPIIHEVEKTPEEIGKWVY